MRSQRQTRNLARTSMPLPTVFNRRIMDCLPLEIGHRIKSATGERDNVVFPIAGAASACLTGRRARMFPLKLAGHRMRSMHSRRSGVQQSHRRDMADQRAKNDPSKIADHDQRRRLRDRGRRLGSRSSSVGGLAGGGGAAGAMGPNFARTARRVRTRGDSGYRSASIVSVSRLRSANVSSSVRSSCIAAALSVSDDRL